MPPKVGAIISTGYDGSVAWPGTTLLVGLYPLHRFCDGLSSRFLDSKLGLLRHALKRNDDAYNYSPIATWVLDEIGEFIQFLPLLLQGRSGRCARVR